MTRKWAIFFLFDCVLMRMNEVSVDKTLSKAPGHILKLGRILAYEWYRTGGKKVHLKEFLILAYHYVILNEFQKVQWSHWNLLHKNKIVY